MLANFQTTNFHKPSWKPLLLSLGSVWIRRSIPITLLSTTGIFLKSSSLTSPMTVTSTLKCLLMINFMTGGLIALDSNWMIVSTPKEDVSKYNPSITVPSVMDAAKNKMD